MDESNLITIHEKIITGDLLGAIDELSTIDNGSFSNELLSLKAQIHDIVKSELLSLESSSNITLRKNKIRNSILELIRLIRSVRNTPPSTDHTLELVMELAGIIETTFNTWRAQCKLRNTLVKLLKERYADLSYDTTYDLLSDKYSEMNDRERRLHSAIRGYTQHIILPKNREALALLKNNPTLKRMIPDLNYLNQHLLLWESKYNSIFMANASICLIYVGIEEKMQFPPTLLDQLKVFIDEEGKH
ncbi:MAG: hypothetical protein DA408_17900 [Bacteroidetes bacterium]|nr:MAG: hypothetical protein C7N36_17260 [Bacteroidota bacterium]PTM09627.1 MAG: hypothetical protein DA408_17900 [Bacteroidota bacterium]